MMTNVNRTVLFLVVGILTFVCLWFILNPTFKKPQDPMQLATLINNTTPLAPFSLVDTNHQKFTSQNLKGHWNVLFFGYTHCPDICPATLTVMRDVWHNFDTPPARFIFASVDPQNDSDKDLKTFLGHFHKNFIGLTGEQREMKNLMQQLNIFADESEERIDHTAALMLINPKGQLKAVFTPPLDPNAITHDLKLLTQS